MLPTITLEGKAALDALIKEVIQEQQLPALFLTACNAEEVIYENQDGWVDFDQKDKRVDVNTTLHLFSMTKLITSIAIHILVDQGKATLHDADLVGQYLPEIALGRLELLAGWDDAKDEPILRKATKGVTLAQLLSHSAGFCYPSNGPPAMTKYLERFPRKGLFEKGASISDYTQPVIFEPGESFHYSIGLDWAGFFIERRTGMSLEDFFIENIFQPLGINLSFFPKPEITEHLIKPCALDVVTGKLTVLPPSPMGKPLVPEDVTVLNGGGGLYGTTRDYLKVLQAVLRCKGGYENPLLSTQSYKALFDGVLAPDGLQKLRGMINEGFYNAPIGDIQYSPGLLLYTDGGEYGRKPGSGSWSGVMKTIYWIDPESGIAAECNTQVLASRNDNAIGWTVHKFEKALYQALR